MLKRILCTSMCIVLLLLAGCQKNETVKKDKQTTAGKNDFVLGQDDQSNLNMSGTPCLQREDGYLLGISNLLEYFDWKTKKVVPFCNRADCSHELGSDCTARQRVANFGYYNAK